MYGKNHAFQVTDELKEFMKYLYLLTITQILTPLRCKLSINLGAMYNLKVYIKKHNTEKWIKSSFQKVSKSKLKVEWNKVKY